MGGRRQQRAQLAARRVRQDAHECGDEHARRLCALCGRDQLRREDGGHQWDAGGGEHGACGGGEGRRRGRHGHVGEHGPGGGEAAAFAGVRG